MTVPVQCGFAPGVIGIATSFLGRYREFDVSVTRTMAPEGTEVEWSAGINVERHFNEMCRFTLAHHQYQWLWILGDDHVWDPRLLMGLLAREVDVVVPLCLARADPFRPVIHNRNFKPLDFNWLEGKSGCLDVTDELHLGNAGMLIRRHVLEKMRDPWFETGRLNPELHSSDLYWCHKLREAGYRYHLDTENLIGHLTHIAVWPSKQKDGWAARLCPP